MGLARRGFRRQLVSRLAGFRCAELELARSIDDARCRLNDYRADERLHRDVLRRLPGKFGRRRRLQGQHSRGGFVHADDSTPSIHFFTSLTAPVTTQGPQTMAIELGRYSRPATMVPSTSSTALFRYDVSPLTVMSTWPANGSPVSLPIGYFSGELQRAYSAASIDVGDLHLSHGADHQASRSSTPRPRAATST